MWGSDFESFDNDNDNDPGNDSGYESGNDAEIKRDDNEDWPDDSTFIEDPETDEDEDWSDDEIFIPNVGIIFLAHSLEAESKSEDSRPASPLKIEGESPILCPIPIRCLNWVFTVVDSEDEGSDYSMTSDSEPASPALTGVLATWSCEGNPFADQFAPVFEEMDVEGLIREPGFKFEDNDHLRLPAGATSALDPHQPHNLCGCRWCESYRVGGNSEPHDINKWCSCVHCVRFRRHARLRNEGRETERRWNEEMRRLHDEAKVVDEEFKTVDLMDFVPDAEEVHQDRGAFFKTIKNQLRTRSP